MCLRWRIRVLHCVTTMWPFSKKQNTPSLSEKMGAFLEMITEDCTKDFVERPLPPWLVWMTVVLLRQHERQIWHQKIVNEHLKKATTQSGDVPGMSGWMYFFHGIGCCLTSPSGETIDVDAHELGSGIIDPWFFASRIESLRNDTGFPEWHLWRWMPSKAFIVEALADLRHAGIIEYAKDNHVFCLSSQLIGYAGRLALLDWKAPSVNALLERVKMSEVESEPKSLYGNAAFQSYLENFFSDRKRINGVLSAAKQLMARETLRGKCVQLLAGEIDAATGAVIETLRTIPDAKADAAICATIARISPEAHLPYPAYQAFCYLFERRVRREKTLKYFRCFTAVEKAHGFGGNPFLGSYAELALLYVPEDAMALVRRALRSNTPLNVNEIAALLAAIDQPWCHRELLHVLNYPTLVSRPCVIEALRHSSDANIRKLAAEYDKPPVRKEEQIGYTFEEVEYYNVGELFERPFFAASSKAGQLRAKYPADWDGSVDFMPFQ